MHILDIFPFKLAEVHNQELAPPQISPYVCLDIQEIIHKNMILFLFSLIKPSETKAKAIEKVDDLLELYMGIRDIDLGKIILFKKVLCVNLMELNAYLCLACIYCQLYFSR